MIHIATASNGDVIGEQLQWHDFEDGCEQFRSLRDINHVIRGLGNILIALCCQSDHFTRPRFDFLQV